MKKPLLLIAMLMCVYFAHAQMDLLLFKEKNRTRQTWTRGDDISFQFSSRQWIRGYIKDIRNDSLLIDMFFLVSRMNSLGVFQRDTAKAGLLKLHVKEIYALPVKGKTSSLTDGSLFKVIGVALALLNVSNSLIRHEQVFSTRNLSMLGVAGGLFVIGSLMKIGHRDAYVIGKRYTLTILHTSSNN